MLDDVKRFDMSKRSKRQRLLPLAWALSYPDIIKHKNKITKVNMKGLKPPYLLLCNHNAFMDFKVATAAVFPHRANYVVAIDGFLKREWLLRAVGCICKRKFTNDIVLIKQLKYVIDRGDIAVVYPEARYSLCGTTAVLPESLGKLAKLFKVPVVTLICHGHHINSPLWNLTDRKLKGTQATMKQILTADELKTKSVEEINEILRNEFYYDDFAWQKENGIIIDFPKRAEGLHKVLYQCPNCKAEYKMSSKGEILRCDACGKEWEMTELGELKATKGKTEFSHIPDWYEWERKNVRREINDGKYYFHSAVRVDSLPNADGYIDLGKGTLTHDKNGFLLEGEYKGEKYVVEKPVASLYSCHIEYEYLGKFGDCVDLNTNTDTYYIYPEGKDFSVTKIALATEELYNAEMERKKQADEKN